MATVLLTGGTGFIGSHTAVELLNRGDEVIIADNLSNSNTDVLERISSITGKQPIFYQVNIVSHEELSEIFSKNIIDAVIHFAGFKVVGESIAEPLKYYRNNLDTTLTLLEKMNEFYVKRLVFSSSAAVYGLNCQVPCEENMPTGQCSNPYGWTKYMIEQILKDAALADPELSVAILRYFNPIGAHESGLIGEKPTGIPNNLMPYITQVAAGVREKLSVYGDDYPTHDGTGVRDYIHVVDLARGHLSALDYTKTHTGAEVFNLGTGKGYSVLDLVHTFQEVNKVEISYAITPRRTGDIAASYADVRKAEQMLDWKAEKDIQDMCRDAWRWQKNSECVEE